LPVRYLSDPELARLSSWPDEIAIEDAVTYFTLSADDLSWLAGFNRPHNRLGVAVQVSTLPWLGWIPDDRRKGVNFQSACRPARSVRSWEARFHCRNGGIS
jgi:Domain of unknown function (DUF4158)